MLFTLPSGTDDCEEELDCDAQTELKSFEKLHDSNSNISNSLNGKLLDCENTDSLKLEQTILFFQKVIMREFLKLRVTKHIYLKMFNQILISYLEKLNVKFYCQKNRIILNDSH